jgi:hypothetical protein
VGPLSKRVLPSGSAAVTTTGNVIVRCTPSWSMTIVLFFGFGLLRVPALIPLSTVNWIWESETPSNSSSLTHRSLPEPTYDLGEGHPLLGRRHV